MSRSTGHISPGDSALSQRRRLHLLRGVHGDTQPLRLSSVPRARRRRMPPRDTQPPPQRRRSPGNRGSSCRWNERSIIRTDSWTILTLGIQYCPWSVEDNGMIHPFNLQSTLSKHNSWEIYSIGTWVDKGKVIATADTVQKCPTMNCFANRCLNLLFCAVPTVIMSIPYPYWPMCHGL